MSTTVTPERDPAAGTRPARGTAAAGSSSPPAPSWCWRWRWAARIWWYLRDDAPAAVNLESASAQVGETTDDDDARHRGGHDAGHGLRRHGRRRRPRRRRPPRVARPPPLDRRGQRHVGRQHVRRRVQLRELDRHVRRLPGPGGAVVDRLDDRRRPHADRHRHHHVRRHDARRGDHRGRHDARSSRTTAGATTGSRMRSRPATFPTATFTLTQPIDLGDAVNTGAAREHRGDRRPDGPRRHDAGHDPARGAARRRDHRRRRIARHRVCRPTASRHRALRSSCRCPTTPSWSCSSSSPPHKTGPNHEPETPTPLSRRGLLAMAAAAGATVLAACSSDGSGAETSSASNSAGSSTAGTTAGTSPATTSEATTATTAASTTASTAGFDDRCGEL